MKKINLKNQMITVTVVIIILSFVIIFLVIIPVIKNIIELRTDITGTQQFLENQYEKTQRMRRSVHNLDDILIQIEKFKNISVTSNSELQIITQLEQLANKHNVNQVLKATLKEGENKNPIIEELPSLLKGKDYYIFSFNTEGNYIDLMKYLKEIEELPYYFSINSLQLSQKSQLSPKILKFDAILFILDHEK